jgi:spore maturation protein SpmA
VLNAFWFGLLVAAVGYAAFNGRMGDVSLAFFESAKAAIELVIGLAGAMIFMLGLMRIARDGGLLALLTRGLRPILRRLFPQVPERHPAMGAMIMNLASNILGLGNAATPFGLKAMKELARLSPHPGVATDAMVLFLCINATSVVLMAPTGTMALRSAAGSTAPAAIWVPTLIATTCSTLTAVAAFYLLGRLPRFAPPPVSAAAAAAPDPAEADGGEAAEGADLLPEARRGGGPGPWRIAFAAGIALALAFGLVREARSLRVELPAAGVLSKLSSDWSFPLLIAGLLLVGLLGRVRVYEAAVEGAREGLEVVARIVPYLVLILVAVGMFRASGALDLVVRGLDPLTSRIGFPAEALPVALLRPLSAQGAFAVMAETLKVHGPDSFVGNLVSTLVGSTETTFYVLTLYAGAAGVQSLRHALPACLIGDLAGFVGATAACHLFFD